MAGEPPGMVLRRPVWVPRTDLSGHVPQAPRYQVGCASTPPSTTRLAPETKRAIGETR